MVQFSRRNGKLYRLSGRTVGPDRPPKRARNARYLVLGQNSGCPTADFVFAPGFPFLIISETNDENSSWE